MTETQKQTNVCPRCGKTTRSHLPDRVCPKCLMGLAMNVGDPTTAQDSNAALDHGHVPPVEKLVAEFPDLEILHLIGHGGMGAVYQARQVNLDRIVALKILSPRLSRDPAFAERFLREARTLAKLSHPNIVTVFDFGQAGEFYYLTMEFVDGVNLRDTISANLLEPAEALAIVPQVCDALQYAHDNGVVHRDIKPENILIGKSGGIKIADFGLAKLLVANPEQFTLTGTRQVLGTRNYMAPEQIETPESVDHRADLYSLGVVFYELLTGELPLGRFSLPSEKSDSVSTRLDDVVMRTLEKDPGRRYQQASQIRTACESVGEPNAAIPKSNAAKESSSTSENSSNQFHDNESSPVCSPFPVTIQDIYASFAAGYGLMRGYDSYIELEYEIRDTVVDHKWASSKVQVPLDRIVWIKLHEGWFRTYIEIQADQFDAVSEIPNSKQGLFRVSLKKPHRGSAQQLVTHVQQVLSNKMTGHARPPVKQASLKSRYDSEGQSDGGVKTLLIFLIVTLGLAASLAFVFGIIWFAQRGAVPENALSDTEMMEVLESSTSTLKAKIDSSKSKADAGSSDSVSAKAEVKKDVSAEATKAESHSDTNSENKQ